MPDQLQRDALIDCAITLAQDIACASPDCADKALRIIEIVGEMRRVPDHQTIRDSLELGPSGTDLSEAQLHLATAAVLSALEE